MEYSNNYSEALWLFYSYYLWLFYRDELTLDDNDVIVDFTDINTTASIEFKEKNNRSNTP